MDISRDGITVDISRVHKMLKIVLKVMRANPDHTAQVAPVSSPTWTGVWTANTSRPTREHQRDCISRYPVRKRRGEGGREGGREKEREEKEEGGGEERRGGRRE